MDVGDVGALIEGNRIREGNEKDTARQGEGQYA